MSCGCHISGLPSWQTQLPQQRFSPSPTQATWCSGKCELSRHVLNSYLTSTTITFAPNSTLATESRITTDPVPDVPGRLSWNHISYTMKWKTQGFLPGKRISETICPPVPDALPGLVTSGRPLGLTDHAARESAEQEGPRPEGRRRPRPDVSFTNNTASLSLTRPVLSGPLPARSRPQNPAGPFDSSLVSGSGPTTTHVLASENRHIRGAASGPLTNFSVPESPFLKPSHSETQRGCV